MCQTNSTINSTINQTEKTNIINFLPNEKLTLPKKKDTCKNCESCSKNEQKMSEKE